ncbi:MAG: protein-methionine-sulfoxide reductase catalytic subunit MsrP [Anaerolineaceae bacterium]
MSEKKPDEITPEAIYLSRRAFMKNAITFSSAAFLAACTAKTSELQIQPTLSGITDELGNPSTTDADIYGFTNYYEFSSDKKEPSKLAQGFSTSPWSIQISGLVKEPKEILVAEMKTQYSIIERIYRMRCVEGWSMVIPWSGILLKEILDMAKPTTAAKFVRFEGVLDPEQMPGQLNSVYPWPYVEGLRLDEAMHDLTLLATGIYGKDLTPQNGAPLRLVVPWKYGFKSIKAIKKIELVADMPTSFWMALSPREYGFYANVNPSVSHPRWSQASEQRIGESGRRDTLLFNGYEDQVSDLYNGMDLAVNF